MLSYIPGDIHSCIAELLDVSGLRLMSEVLGNEIIYKYKLIRMKHAIKTIEKICQAV